jgi:hypothetical protein
MVLAKLAEDLRYALDRVEFACIVDVEPDDWQERLLRSEANRIALNASRQSGKSTMAALLALHEALYVPGSLSLLLSPTLRQSGELFKKARDAYHMAKGAMPGGAVSVAQSETALTLTLENGSRIVSLPGKEHTVRGYSAVSLLVVDEASRVPGDLYFSVLPMLAVSAGRMITLSTPWGSRGWWYDAWRQAEDDDDRSWERYLVPATSCPRISPEFLEEQRKTMGEYWFRQEFLCEFLDAETQAFTREQIDRAFREEYEEWDLLAENY